MSLTFNTNNNYKFKHLSTSTIKNDVKNNKVSFNVAQADYSQGSQTVNGEDYSSIDFGNNEVKTTDDLIKATEPKYNARKYTVEQEKAILESIKDKVNDSVENEIYDNFNAECRYKFGVDLKDLDSVTGKDEALNEFKRRMEKEREYYQQYYTWLYFNSETGNIDFDRNILDAFSQFFINGTVSYESYSLGELFKDGFEGISYERLMSIMTDEEIAYYNYLFKVKYTEYLCSDECNNTYTTDESKKLAAIEYARREVENEMFHTQSFEYRMGALAAINIIKDKYKDSFQEISLTDEISMREALHCQLNGETVLTRDGKFYKVENLPEGWQLLRGPNGEYYKYFADTSLFKNGNLNSDNEFVKWFNHSFWQEGFTIYKGATSIFMDSDELRAFNKSDYEQFYIDDVANRTILGSYGYEIGSKTYDVITSEVIKSVCKIYGSGEMGANAAAGTFWAVVGYGIGRKSALKSGYSESEAVKSGIFAGANLAGVEFIPNISTKFGVGKISEKIFGGVLGIAYLFGLDFLNDLVVESGEYDASAYVTEESLREILKSPNFKISDSDKEIFIEVMTELFDKENGITYNDLTEILKNFNS